MVLLVLALVPMATLVALWGWTSSQLYMDWQQQQERRESSTRAAAPIASATFYLQEERRLSGVVVTDPAKYQKQLRAQRARTDEVAEAVEALPSSGWKAPNDIRRKVVELGDALRKLADYRAGVDGRTASQQQTFDRYTDLIARHIQVFDTLTNIGQAGIDRYATVIIDESWGMEMFAREDALLTRVFATGRLSGSERRQLAGWIGSQQSIYDYKVVPLLPANQAEPFRKLMRSRAWQNKADIEQTMLDDSATGNDREPSSDVLAGHWRESADQVSAELRKRAYSYGQDLEADTKDKVQAMKTRLIVTSVSNAVAVSLVALITALAIRMLRGRISALRTAALDMQTRLPDVVGRMRKGETVDVDAEIPAIPVGSDELGQLGQALNLARHTALDTTVAQVGQFRGFEQLLQRIARRTQLLIGLQMRKLSELERKHEDPEVLEDLFDLDHLTARLRRYEENLVILGGGQPQRRWRKPVLLLDVLRSAQSEVQDYRRIHIEVESRLWLSERAVGLVIHVLAELMENAVGFSKPPAPVEVYAARVGRGLAVEIEDRGVGMDSEQYDAINRMMAEPPRMDVMSRADDVRLGLYVVARLTQGLGIQVELRASAFGGTRVVVLIPDELVVDFSPDAGTVPDEAVTSSPSAPDSTTRTTMHGTGPTNRHGAFAAGPEDNVRFDGTPLTADERHAIATPASGGTGHPNTAQETITLRLRTTTAGPARRSAPATTVKPLPRRVRQASLNDELRTPVATARATQPDDEQAPVPRTSPSRSGAAIGAFQRQSRMTRRTTSTGDHDHGVGGVLPPAREFPTED
ncbi:sensor histidine kinase [Streptomyces plumbiresistens]|uniref:histidine kinase n=1 Tax=Streptomyces plumbiresistens TaxID=511811 RepID=A0ABP7TED2_9ACTN